MKAIFEVSGFTGNKIETILKNAIDSHRIDSGNVIKHNLDCIDIIREESYVIGAVDTMALVLDAEWGRKPDMHVTYTSYSALDECGLSIEVVTYYTSSGNKLVLRIDAESIDDDYEDAYVYVGYNGTRGRFLEEMGAFEITADDVKEIMVYETSGPEDMGMFDTQYSYIVDKYEAGDTATLSLAIRDCITKPDPNCTEQMLKEYYAAISEDNANAIDEVHDVIHHLDRLIQNL